MDCKTAQLLLIYHRPQPPELEQAEVEALESHLAQCPECSASARDQGNVDERLATAMRDVPIPTGLKDRLMVRLENERNAVYRPRAFGMGAAALAASLLIGIGGYFTFRERPSRPLELAGLSLQALTAKQPDQLEQWFAKEHHPIRLPSELADRWDFKHLTAAYLGHFQGQAVPILEFTSPKGHARVLLLRQGQYKSDEVAGFQQSPYPNTPRVLGKPDADSYIAIAFFSEGSKEADFLKGTKPLG